MRDDSRSKVMRQCKQALAFVQGQSDGMALGINTAITVNFHPDAEHDGRIMIASLAKDGFYRSQFETGISNGALAKHSKAGRLLWERQIFGGAYEDCNVADRPKYGALNFKLLAIGASPRFGSAHLRLKPSVLSRSTFCFPDSHMGAREFGTADRIGLLERLDGFRSLPDPLDHYVEAHMHGPLEIKEDVEAVVLDPSHQGTDVEEAAHELGCGIEWHSGFFLTDAHLSDCVAYRSEDVADLAASLFDGGIVTPAAFGYARRAELAGPKTLKHLWHCIARFGAPVSL